MKKVLGIIISAAILMQMLVVPCHAETERLVIKSVDFDNDIGFVTSVSGGASTRLEQTREDFGYSYVLHSTATESALTQLGSVNSDFQSGELTLEMDFMYTNKSAVYYLVHLRSVLDDGTVNHNRDCFIKNGKCGSAELEANKWYHIKYIVNLDERKSEFYIDGIKAGSNENVIFDGNFDTWRVSVQDAETDLWIDNMQVSKMTTRTAVESVKYYNAREAEFDNTAIGTELMYAEVCFDRGIDFDTVANDNVFCCRNGKLQQDGYYVKADKENPKRIFIYFAENLSEGTKYSIKFTGLADERGLALMKDSKIEFEIGSPSYSDAVYTIYNYDGTEIDSVDEIADGDKIRMALKFKNVYEDAWKPCILAFAVYGEDGRLIDVISDKVTVNPYTPDVSLSTDYITVSNPNGEKLHYKGFLWEQETLSPQIEKFMLEQKEQDNVGALTADFSAFTEFKADKIVNPSEYFSGYADAKEEFKDTVCFVIDADRIYGLGKKYIIEEAPIYKDGEILAPKSVMAKIFNKSFASKAVKDGVEYVSLKDAASQMSLYYSQSYKGLGVISEKPTGIEMSSKLDSVKKIIKYIVFDRPSADSLKKMLESKPNPRVLASYETLEQIANSNNKTMRELSDTLLRDADTLLNSVTPAETPTTSQPVGASYGDILKLYWAYAMTNDSKYADKAIEHAMTMANWEHWMDTYYFLATSYNMLTCGYVYDLFQDELTPQQRETLREAIYEKGLLPAKNHYYGKGQSNWPLRNFNWNVVCNAGAIVSALAICSDYETDSCFDIIEKALVSLEYAILEFAPDGGWYEGMGYSLYTTNYFTLTLQSLMTAFGTEFNLAKSPGFVEYGTFPFYMTGAEGMVALSDEIRGNHVDCSTAAQWIANYSNDTVLQEMRMSQLKNTHNIGATFFDMLWYMPKEEKTYISAPLEHTYSYAGMTIARSGWEGDATFLSVHAGDNAVPHGQVDIGQFELEVDGTRFALDMGRDDYGLPNYFYFGSTREEYYVCRAEGHNVYVINPDETPGQYYYARSSVETVSEKPDGVIYTIDMTPPYISQVKKAQRGFMLTDNRKVFVMQDEITPKKSGDEYYWFWHTDADITIDSADNSHVTLTKNGRSLELYFKSNIDFTITSGESVPLPTSPKGEGEQLTTYGTVNKITARFTSGNDDIKFRVTAVHEGHSYNTNARLSAISEWEIADGIRSDRYTIENGTISQVPANIETADFLAHIYTGKASKRLVSDGAEYTASKLSGAVVLEVTEDGHTDRYSIEYITPTFKTFCEPEDESFDGTVYGTTTAAQDVAGWLTYFGYASYGQQVSVKREAVNGDEKAIRIQSTGTTEPLLIQMFADFKQEDSIDSEWISLEYDFKADGGNATFYLEGRFAGVARNIVGMNADGTVTAFDRDVSSYKKGEWNHVKVCINPGGSNVYRLYLNGELVNIGYANWLGVQSPMTQVKIRVQADAGQQISLWFDNVKAERIFG